MSKKILLKIEKRLILLKIYFVGYLVIRLCIEVKEILRRKENERGEED